MFNFFVFLYFSTFFFLDQKFKTVKIQFKKNSWRHPKIFDRHCTYQNSTLTQLKSCLPFSLTYIMLIMSNVILNLQIYDWFQVSIVKCVNKTHTGLIICILYFLWTIWKFWTCKNVHPLRRGYRIIKIFSKRKFIKWILNMWYLIISNLWVLSTKFQFVFVTSHLHHRHLLSHIPAF